MDPAALVSLIPAVRTIARTAGDAILEVYEGRIAVEATSKQDDSPLTRADLASHEVLVGSLRDLEEGVPVVSEEDATRDESERRSWSTFWLVDPLDGTKEFLKRNGEFTVNVALIDDGRPVLGVVHVPVTGVTYAGAAGTGAVRIDRGAEPRTIEVRGPSDRDLTVVASRSHRDEATDRLLAAFETRFDVAVATKGSSLKICEVAEGRAHVYPRTGPTMEWDTAAAQAVLEAAGGVLLRLDASRWGEPLRYGREELRNPAFVAAFGRAVLGYPGMAELRVAA